MKARVSLLLLSALVFMVAALASAQDGDPQPILPIPTNTPTATALPPTVTTTALPTLAVTTDQMLFAPQVEIAFPAGVRFFVRAAARADTISAASLTLERQGQPTQTFNLDLASAAEAVGDTTDLTYIWELTPQVYPRFFETIDFRWTVRTSEAVNTAQGRFEFTDQRVIWESATTETLRLVMPGDLGLGRLSDVMGEVEQLMRETTGSDENFAFILYETTLDPAGCTVVDDVPYAYTLSGIALRCLDSNLAQRIFDASGLAVLRVRSYTQADMQNALTRTLFDRYYRPLWADRAVPEWFAYGLMRIFAPTRHDDSLSIVENAARNNRLLSLPDAARIPDDPALLQDWQAQSLAMTLYMADRLGYPRLFEFAVALQREDFESSYAQVMNQSLNALIPSMRDWLFTERGPAAFSVSIYAQATNTPAPRSTATAFPPTRTPRPEPSATMTATVTLTPSPRPTATPTASVTPRPPGSLATATPIPPAVTAPSAPTAEASTIAIVGIVIAVLVILFAGVRRR
jgi:hypothetical protein